MKTGKVCKREIRMDGFSKHEAESVTLSLREDFPGSSISVQKRKDEYSLSIVPPVAVTAPMLAKELFPLFNIRLR